MRLIRLLLLSTTLLLTACLPAQAPFPTQAPAPALPTATLSPSPTLPAPSATPTANPSPVPSPTPEPVRYTVKESDDMFSIALYFGISLDSLKEANPEVNPYAMGAGTQLLIPITPTPGVQKEPNEPNKPATTSNPNAELICAQPVCYPEGRGGAWCFAELQNPGDRPLENPTALIRLHDSGGALLQEKSATIPLNILPGNSHIPVYTYFDGPLPPDFSATAEAGDFLPVLEGDSRYLGYELPDPQISYRREGRIADLTGSLKFSSSSSSSVRILAIGYDAKGQVTGLRLWENNAEALSSPLPYRLSLYALGKPIVRVALFAELRP